MISQFFLIYRKKQEILILLMIKGIEIALKTLSQPKKALLIVPKLK